jgi:hypothetical protein
MKVLFFCFQSLFNSGKNIFFLFLCKVKATQSQGLSRKTRLELHSLVKEKQQKKSKSLNLIFKSTFSFSISEKNYLMPLSMKNLNTFLCENRWTVHTINISFVSSIRIGIVKKINFFQLVTSVDSLYTTKMFI